MAKRRKSGEGSVHLRKDGRWEGRYVIDYDDKGYPKTRNVLAKTKSKCQAKLKHLREQFGNEDKSHDTLCPDMRFGVWLDFWYQNYLKPKLRVKTQEEYELRIYRHILPELGAISLNKLTAEDLQRFYNRLKKGGRLSGVDLYGPGLSDRSVRGCHVTCRAALDRAVRDGLLSSNPALGCKLPPASKREMQVLTREEMQRFLIQAKEEGYHELFLLELTTGLRRGELLALQWEDLNFKTGELRVTKQVSRLHGKLTVTEPKTKASARTVILPPAVTELLRARQKVTGSRWMFPSPKRVDVPLDPAAVRKLMDRLLERARCKKVRFHDLRHTFATTALEYGMDVKTLSTVIGHSSAATTLNIYTHITDEMRAAAAVNIDRGIAKQEPAALPKKQEAKQTAAVDFQPYHGTRRSPGTGCISQIGDHLWEGRYSPKWPDGKKHSRNVYAHSREECEEKLAELITRMKTEIAALKRACGAVE